MGRNKSRYCSKNGRRRRSVYISTLVTLLLSDLFQKQSRFSNKFLTVIMQSLCSPLTAVKEDGAKVAAAPEMVDAKGRLQR